MEATADAAAGQPSNFAELSPVDRRKQWPALARSYRRADRSEALAAAVREIEPVAPLPEGSPHEELERLTASFRVELARRHVSRGRDASVRFASAFAQWEATDDFPDGDAAEECGTCGRLSHVVSVEGQTFWTACEGDGTRALDVARAELVEEMRDALTSRKWHEQRERGQRDRFEKVRACGSRMMIAKCSLCGSGTGKQGETRMIPEGCGVRRVCGRCDTAGAMQRRARFGAARGRCFVDGDRYGLRRQHRRGGRYTEKMLTLTVPHFKLSDARRARGKTPGVRELARDDLDARIVALWLAWPRFMRRVVEHFTDKGEDHFSWHRSFEWTPGSDGIGHPHFHVYWFSPFLHVDLIRQWWADALRDVGWPVETVAEEPYFEGSSKFYPAGLTVRRRRGSRFRPRLRDRIVVHLKMLHEFNADMARELMKGGRQQSLKLSRIDFEPGDREHGTAGLEGFSYAEGWTIGDVEAFCSPDVRARLYKALEGRRLTQASSGFFLDDDPPICACCGHSHWRVKFEAAPVESPPVGFSVPGSRGPPH